MPQTQLFKIKSVLFHHKPALYPGFSISIDYTIIKYSVQCGTLVIISGVSFYLQPYSFNRHSLSFTYISPYVTSYSKSILYFTWSPLIRCCCLNILPLFSFFSKQPQLSLQTQILSCCPYSNIHQWFAIAPRIASKIFNHKVLKLYHSHCNLSLISYHILLISL